MSGFRILMVDDNPDHRFLIKRALNAATDMDLVVDAAEDGEEALAYLRREGQFSTKSLPHMVLLDLRMPRMSGLEVLQAMRADADLRSVPVCVLTSSNRDEDIAAAYNLGTNTYVVKSGDSDALRHEIAAVREFWTGITRVPEPR